MEKPLWLKVSYLGISSERIGLQINVYFEASKVNVLTQSEAINLAGMGRERARERERERERVIVFVLLERQSALGRNDYG